MGWWIAAALVVLPLPVVIIVAGTLRRRVTKLQRRVAWLQPGIAARTTPLLAKGAAVRARLAAMRSPGH